MLTLAVAFLLIGIFAGIFGFIVAGPVGLLAFAVFFALFLWLLARDRQREREGRPPE